MNRYNSNHPALTVGQEVVVCRNGSWETHYTFGWRVTKVTPSGQVVVTWTDSAGVSPSRDRRFSKDGDEMGEGKSEWRGVWIDTDVAGIRDQIATKDARRNAAQLLHGVTTYDQIGRGASKEFLLATAAKMRAALDAADAAIAALPN